MKIVAIWVFKEAGEGEKQSKKDKKKDDRWVLKMRRVGGKRRWQRRDKKEDLERMASQWQDGRNVFSPTHPPTWFSSHSSSVEDAANTPSSPEATLNTPHLPPIVSLFSHPFSSCHSKCYSQLVKVHFTLSSWPEIYTPQCLRRAGEEGCNLLRLMTVHASRRKWWILWFYDHMTALFFKIGRERFIEFFNHGQRSDLHL